MKLELTTENGTFFVLNSFQKNNSPELAVEATIYLKSGEVKFIVVPYVVSKEGYKVIKSDSPVKIGDKKQYLYLALRPEDVSIVNKYFEEVKKQTDELRSHWMELKLGVCFNSDYNYHYWVGDDRTPLSTIIEEGKEILSCCYKPEVMEEIIKEAYSEYWQKKRRVDEKRVEREKLFETAKTTGKPVKLYSYTIDCVDPNADCDLDIVTVFAMPDGTTKEEISHTW